MPIEPEHSQMVTNDEIEIPIGIPIACRRANSTTPPNTSKPLGHSNPGRGCRRTVVAVCDQISTAAEQQIQVAVGVEVEKCR